MMNQCCIEEMVLKGIRERFRLADEGERWECTACGRRYIVKTGQWTDDVTQRERAAGCTCDIAPDAPLCAHEPGCPALLI